MFSMIGGGVEKWNCANESVRMVWSMGQRDRQVPSKPDLEGSLVG